MNKCIYLLACLLLFSFPETAVAQAQPYTRDTSFSLDIDFNVPGSSRRIYGVIEQMDGKLMVYGNFWTNLGRYSAVRFFHDGQVDSGFHLPLDLLEVDSYHMDTTAYGYFMTGEMGYVSKLGHDGQYADLIFENNFGSDFGGTATSAPFFLPDGKYLFGCSGCGYPQTNPTAYLSLLRVLPNGLVDSTFAHNVPGGGVFDFTSYGQDKILVSGNFEYYDSTPTPSICRIYYDGTLDTTFNACLQAAVLRVPHVQPDGKILVKGLIKVQGSNQELSLVRLNPDGSLDSTFNNFSAFANWAEGGVTAICPTPDGGYLFGGMFSQYQGYPAGGIVKVDSNGYYQPGYFTGTGFDSVPFNNATTLPLISSIKRGSNDQYYVCGYFNGYNGQAVQPIIRLNGPQTVSAEEEVEPPAFALYPNPAAGTVRLRQLSSGQAPIRISISDLLGRSLLEQALPKTESEINISTLPAGIYLVSVTDSSGKKWQQKLVVQR